MRVWVVLGLFCGLLRAQEPNSLVLDNGRSRIEISKVSCQRHGADLDIILGDTRGGEPLTETSPALYLSLKNYDTVLKTYWEVLSQQRPRTPLPPIDFSLTDDTFGTVYLNDAVEGPWRIDPEVARYLGREASCQVWITPKRHSNQISFQLRCFNLAPIPRDLLEPVHTRAQRMNYSAVLKHAAECEVAPAGRSQSQPTRGR